MKALTLWQPRASLVIGRHKFYETRSWTTNYRGPLAIHAAKRLEKDQVAFVACNKYVQQALKTMGFQSVVDLPRGAVLGTVYLSFIKRVEQCVPAAIGANEISVGDWSPGRYAWSFMAQFPVRFSEPIPVRGYQRLWNWEVPDGCRTGFVHNAGTDVRTWIKFE